VASLIINRIIDNNDNPIFVFRSYSDWEPVLKQELGKKFSIEGKEKKNKYDKISDCFYEFSGQNAAMSNNNIHRVLKTDEYINIKESLGKINDNKETK